MSVQIVIQQMLMILILIGTGYILKKTNKIKSSVSKDLSALVVNVCNPAIIITSALQRDSSVTGRSLLYAAAAAFVMYVFLVVVGKVMPVLLKTPFKDRNSYNMMCVFGNTGFIGIPLVSALVGAQALIYVAVTNIFFYLLIYTYGIHLVARDSGTKEKFQVKNLLNTGNLATLLAILLFLGEWKFPPLAEETLDYMGGATTFLAMIVIGITIADTPIHTLFTEKKIYFFTVLRFLVLPIGIGLGLKWFIKDSTLLDTLVIIAAVPAGNMPLMLMMERGMDGKLLSKGIIISTLASVITIPLVLVAVCA